MFFTDLFLSYDLNCTNLLKNYKNKSHREITEIEIKKLCNALKTLQDKSKFRNVIIIGHEPIIQHVGNELPKQIFNEIGVNILLNIYEAFSNTNNYYLCADVHMYQKSEFIMKANKKSVYIKQYVLGTGGADLQKQGIPTKYNQLNLSGINLEKNLLQISNKHLQKKSLPNIESYLLCEISYTHGYLECDYSKDDLEFRFIDCISNIGGKKIKSTKKVRKHQGIYQRGAKKGKLKPGFKYSDKKTKTGLKVIVKVKK